MSRPEDRPSFGDFCPGFDIRRVFGLGGGTPYPPFPGPEGAPDHRPPPPTCQAVCPSPKGQIPPSSSSKVLSTVSKFLPKKVTKVSLSATLGRISEGALLQAAFRSPRPFCCTGGCVPPHPKPDLSLVCIGKFFLCIVYRQKRCVSVCSGKKIFVYRFVSSNFENISQSKNLIVMIRDQRDFHIPDS